MSSDRKSGVSLLKDSLCIVAPLSLRTVCVVAFDNSTATAACLDVPLCAYPTWNALSFSDVQINVTNDTKQVGPLFQIPFLLLPLFPPSGNSSVHILGLVKMSLGFCSFFLYSFGFLFLKLYHFNRPAVKFTESFFCPFESLLSPLVMFFM